MFTESRYIGIFVNILNMFKIFTPKSYQTCLFTPETWSTALAEMYSKAESSSAGHGHPGHESIQVTSPSLYCETKTKKALAET